MGEDHPQTLAAMWNLANEHEKMEDYNTVSVLLSHHLEKARLVLASTQPDTLAVMKQLAEIHEEMGDNCKAVSYLLDYQKPR